MRPFARVVPDEVWRRAIFDESPIPAGRAGLDGSFLEVNDAYCAITGYARHELLGRTWQSITHPDDLAGDQGGVDDVASGKRLFYQCDKRYIKKFGGTVLGTLYVRGIQREGALQGYYVLFNPIVENAERITYSSEQGRAVYESRSIKSWKDWVPVYPWQAVTLGLGLALLLGPSNVLKLIVSFFTP